MSNNRLVTVWNLIYYYQDVIQIFLQWNQKVSSNKAMSLKAISWSYFNNFISFVKISNRTRVSIFVND